MPARYWLEKNYIFFFLSKNLKHDIRMFLVYGAMSVVTTIIFWSVEYLFHLIFDADLMRYIGAILGLSLGYYLKYQLDKMFVFSNRCIRIKGL
jgi:hypothetical protein